MIETAVCGGLILLLDQWSKRVVAANLRDRSVNCGRLLRLRYVTNRNPAYRTRGARAGLVLFWSAALVSAVLLHEAGRRFQSHGALIGLGLALGGAAGNLLDILRRRAVVDFIDLGWWPVFNLADVGIVGGLAVALGQWS